MFGLNGCNRRAVFFPIVLISALACLSVPSLGSVFLTDDAAGSGGQRFGAASDGIQDINSDGAWEFIVGAPGDNSAGIQAGAAFFWYGDGALNVAPDQLWLGQTAYDEFGWSVARIGDVNDGGKDDWAVGAPAGTTNDSEPGMVYIYFGEQALTQSPLVITGEAANDRFGFSIAAAGDFNADNVDDFIVGAPFNNSPGVDQGAAYIIYGSSSEPSTDLGDALKLTAGQAGDHFGWSVTGGGNFLNTSTSVAVGAPQNDSARGTEAGAVYVYAGGTGFDADYDELIDAGEVNAYGWYGYSVASAHRFNNDGLDDLVIGAPNNIAQSQRAGRVDVIYGSASISNTGDVTVDGEAADDLFGYAVDGVWDVTGTSRDDVVIGAPGVNLDGAGAGRVYLYPGGSGSMGSAASLALPVEIMIPARSDQASDELGYSVSAAGDFDADGLWDYAVGATSGNIFDGSEAGFCRLVDQQGTVVQNDLQLWNADWIDEGLVYVEFRLSGAPTEVANVRLIRETSSGQRTELWNGPAMELGPLVDPANSDVLYRTGSVYQYGDRDPGSDSISYDLYLTGTDGNESGFTALAGPEPTIPRVVAGFELAPAWPNPFNPTTQLRFRADTGEFVQCHIVDLRGHRVRELYQGTATGSWQTLTWDGRSDGGRSVASGVYLVHLESTGAEATRRVVLSK